jgi:hypothetical protein
MTLYSRNSATPALLPATIRVPDGYGSARSGSNAAAGVLLVEGPVLRPIYGADAAP